VSGLDGRAIAQMVMRGYLRTYDRSQDGGMAAPPQPPPGLKEAIGAAMPSSPDDLQPSIRKRRVTRQDFRGLRLPATNDRRCLEDEAPEEASSQTARKRQTAASEGAGRIHPVDARKGSRQPPSRSRQTRELGAGYCSEHNLTALARSRLCREAWQAASRRKTVGHAMKIRLKTTLSPGGAWVSVPESHVVRNAERRMQG
jgi:hypothetical protein